MKKNTWLTKEDFALEIQEKEDQKVKSIVKKYFNENWVKFKNKIKCGGGQDRKIDQELVEEIIEYAKEEIEKNSFIEEDEYIFYQNIIQKMKEISSNEYEILPEDFLIAMYDTTYPGSYEKISELAISITNNDIFYNEQGQNNVEIFQRFEQLNIKEQNNLIKIINILAKSFQKNEIHDLQLLLLTAILKPEAKRLLAKILQYYKIDENITEENTLIFGQELTAFAQYLKWYQKEQPKNKEMFQLLNFIILLNTEYSKEDERKIMLNGSMLSKQNVTSKIFERNIQLAILYPAFLDICQKMDARIEKLTLINQKKKSEVQKKNTILKELQETMIQVLEEQKDPTTFLKLSNEAIDYLPKEYLLPAVEILLDHDTNAFNQLFRKQKQQSVKHRKREISIEERMAQEKVKEYYKNGDFIKMPLDINKFQALLKKANFSEEEMRTILKLASEALKHQKEIKSAIPKKQKALIETSENQLVYLLSDKENCYAIKDIDNIPVDYYASFANLLISIKNGTFKNFKAFKENKRLSGLLEVKDFKTRIIFRRLSTNYYIILGMFMKKTDRDMAYLKFLNRRQEQFNKVQEQLERKLKEQTLQDQDQITTQILEKLQTNKNLKLERKN